MYTSLLWKTLAVLAWAHFVNVQIAVKFSKTSFFANWAPTSSFVLSWPGLMEWCCWWGNLLGDLLLLAWWFCIMQLFHRLCDKWGSHEECGHIHVTCTTVLFIFNIISVMVNSYLLDFLVLLKLGAWQNCTGSQHRLKAQPWCAVKECLHFPGATRYSS